MSVPSPYFSIVLPTCNRVQFIKEAIESVLLQTFDNWELFVINDGSQDGTDKEISQYASDKVRIINLTDNNGVSHARNCALELASGKYIAFLDDDDLYESSFLQTSYDQLKWIMMNMIFIGQVLVFLMIQTRWIRRLFQR